MKADTRTNGVLMTVSSFAHRPSASLATATGSFPTPVSGFWRRAIPGLALALLAAITGCKDEKITDVPVDVDRVDVSTASITLQVGQSTSVSAVAKSQSGQSLTARTIQWSSSNAAVASVTAAGQITGVSSGTATINASAGSVSGSVNVTVIAPPHINVSASVITFSTGQGGQAPAPQTVNITNTGGGTLSGLTIGSITYSAGQPTGWLSFDFNQPTAPAVLTLHASPASLAPGSYTAIVPVRSTAADNSPVNIGVTFNVTAPPTAPAINTFIYSLFELNAASCVPINNGSLIGYGFNFTDANGNVSASGATVNVTFTFQPSGSTGSLTANSTFTGSGFSGSVTFAFCTVWGSDSQVVVNVNLSDDSGLTSNTLTVNVPKPAGANGAGVGIGMSPRKIGRD
jgi:Bacterial Ig-like domain (group 2)